MCRNSRLLCTEAEGHAGYPSAGRVAPLVPVAILAGTLPPSPLVHVLFSREFGQSVDLSRELGLIVVRSQVGL